MSSSLRRIHYDLRDLKRCNCELIKSSTLLEGTKQPTVNVDIVGPDNSLYAGERYTVQVRFPDNYPFVPPTAVFIGVVPLHPHIYSNGHICVSTLADDWSPANTLTSLCLSLISLLGSAEEKTRPFGDTYYVRSASERPDQKAFFFHDNKA